MILQDIKNNNDLLSFIRETVKEISSGSLRPDEGEGAFIELVKLTSRTAIGKRFRELQEYRKKNYFITLLCAGDKGFFVHITKGGDSFGDSGYYEDPEKALTDSFSFVKKHIATGEADYSLISKVVKTRK